MDTHTGEAPGAAVSPLPTTGEAPPRPKPGRRPLDAEKRAKHAERQAVRRMLKKLEDSHSADELWSKVAELKGSGSPASPSGNADALEKSEAPELEPGQRPGWPPPSKVAEFQGLAVSLWQTLAPALAETRYTLAPRRVQMGGDSLEVDPVQTLAEATAPVLAKWLPAALATPEGALIAAVAMVFLPPASAHVAEAVATWWKHRQVSRALEDADRALAAGTGGRS